MWFFFFSELIDDNTSDDIACVQALINAVWVISQNTQMSENDIIIYYPVQYDLINCAIT